MDFRAQTIRVLETYRDRFAGGVNDEAARQLGVSSSTFWRWINGKHDPDMDAVSAAWAAIGGGDIMDAAPEAPEAPEAPDAIVPVLPLDGTATTDEGAMPMAQSILIGLGVRPAAARWMRVPLNGAPDGLQPGDAVLIDTDTPLPSDGGLCALSLDPAGVVLRRMHAQASGWGLSAGKGTPASTIASTDALKASRGCVVLLVREL